MTLHTGTVLAICGTLALGACGSTPEPATRAPDVATLQSTAAAPPSSAPTPAAERPVIPVDDNVDAIGRLETAWVYCLRDNGVPLDTAIGESKTARKEPRYQAAYKTCAIKEPEFWIDREARTNPEYADRLRDAVTCLKSKGHKARLDTSKTPAVIAYPSMGQETAAIDDRDECLREAFADRLKRYPKS